MSAQNKVGVHDVDRLIDNMLQQGPRGMMLRELVVNGIEAKLDPLEGNTRTIRVFADSGKLVIINSGMGMDANDLFDACQIAWSGAHKSHRSNRGEGAKVASLIFNTEGMRYRSRRNGVISQAIISYDPQTQSWPVQISTPSPMALVGAEPNSMITSIERIRYAQFVGDFTEIKLLGMSPNHTTAFEPYDDVMFETNNKAPHEVFQRFYSFPSPPAGLKLDFKFDNAFTRGNQTRPFRTVAEVMAHRANDPNAFEFLNKREVKVGNGIRIEYVKHVRPSTKKGNSNSGGRSPWSNYSLGSDRGFGAIVYRGEMYDVQFDNWGHTSAQYGIVGLQNQLSVFLHLPDDFPVEIDRYRERLMKKKEPVKLADFAQLIAQSRPQWLLDLIQQSVGARRNDRTSAAKLQKYLDKRFARKLITDPNAMSTGGAVPSGKRTGTGPTKTRKSGPSDGNGSGNGNSSMRKGSVDRNKSGNVGAPPSFHWVTDATVTNGLDVGFGAVYNQYLDLYTLNTDYWAFEDLMQFIISDLAIQYPGIKNHLPTVRGLIEPMIKTKVEVDVGLAIIRIKEKSALPHFTMEAITRAYGQDSLSTVFDLCIQHGPDLVRDAQKLSAIQAM